MSYYWFYKDELLQKAKDKYHNAGGKEEAAKYYIANKDDLKEKARNKYRNLSKEKKEAKRERQRDRYHMNTDLDEKVKQYQRNYYDSKKIRK